MYDEKFLFPLPESAQIWPGRLKQPHPGNVRNAATDLKDGFYYRTWPDDRIKFLAKVKGGRLTVWLYLEQKARAGVFSIEGSPWVKQNYYADGRMEDFSPWDDNSPPYTAESTFEEWILSCLKEMQVPRQNPEADEMLQRYSEYLASDRSCTPQPMMDQILSVRDGPPSNLQQILEGFRGWRCGTPGQFYERLVNFLEWDRGRARDFANFLPHACIGAFRDRQFLQDPDMFLHPVWENPCGHGESPLSNIPLHMQIRALALACREKAWAEPEHWLRSMADIHPDMHRCGSHDPKLPWPIIWTLPPAAMDPFSIVMHAVSLLLRQEASRRGALWQYVKNVDAEKFYTAAGLVGAFLQPPYSTAGWCFDRLAFPWDKGADVKPLQEELADFIACFDDGFLLCQRKAHPYGDRTPSWMKAPLLASMGEWIHRKCSSAPLTDADKPVIYQTALFINQYGEVLQERLRAFRKGYLNWDTALPPSWPSASMNDLQGWDGHWQGQRARFRARGEEVADIVEREETFPGLQRNDFLYRVEVAGTILAGGKPEGSPLWRERSAELEGYLARHRELGPHHLSLLQEHVTVVPVKPGRGYTRLLAAAFWAFSGSVPGMGEKPEHLFPALQLMQWILPAF